MVANKGKLQHSEKSIKRPLQAIHQEVIWIHEPLPDVVLHPALEAGSWTRYLGPDRHPVGIAHRPSEEQGIQDVEHSPESGNGPRGIFPLRIALDHRFHEVTELSGKANEQAKSDRLGPAQ